MYLEELKDRKGKFPEQGKAAKKKYGKTAAENCIKENGIAKNGMEIVQESSIAEILRK